MPPWWLDVRTSISQAQERADVVAGYLTLKAELLALSDLERQIMASKAEAVARSFEAIALRLMGHSE